MAPRTFCVHAPAEADSPSALANPLLRRSFIRAPRIMGKKDGDVTEPRVPGGNKLPTLCITPKVTRCRLRSLSPSRGTRHACTIKVGRKRGGGTLLPRRERKSLSDMEGGVHKYGKDCRKKKLFIKKNKNKK